MPRGNLTVFSPFIQFPNYYYYYLSCLPALSQSCLFPVTSLETFQRLGRTWEPGSSPGGKPCPGNLTLSFSAIEEIRLRLHCGSLPWLIMHHCNVFSQELTNSTKVQVQSEVTADCRFSQVCPAPCLSIMPTAIATSSATHLLSTYCVPGNVWGTLCTTLLVFTPTCKASTVSPIWQTRNHDYKNSWSETQKI